MLCFIISEVGSKIMLEQWNNANNAKLCVLSGWKRGGGERSKTRGYDRRWEGRCILVYWRNTHLDNKYGIQARGSQIS